MVHFVGAGPGGPDLITMRGARLLSEADCVIYAGSLVNPALLALTKEGASIYNSAQMTLEPVSYTHLVKYPLDWGFSSREGKTAACPASEFTPLWRRNPNPAGILLPLLYHKERCV